MEHKDIVLDKLLLTEPIRIKAQLKYELRNLEAHLARLIKAKNQQPNYFVEVANLCQLLIDKYLSYLSLMGAAIPPSFFQTLEHDKPKAWFEHYQLLLKLKQQLHGASSEEEKNLTIDILTLYFYIKQTHLESMQPEAPYSVNDGIYKLFLTGDLKIWLVGLIHYWNQNTAMSIDFQAWPKQQLLYAIDFFASTECVHLINALFFYTLFPEQLEKNLHPEKRISLQLKIEHLHSYLTLLRQQLYKVAALNGIKPEVDFLCHSKDLPSGITFEVHSSYQTLILEAVKLFKLSVTSLENKLDKVHLIQAIFTAYKFRFDPCRFIDTAMVLRQVIDARDEQVFSQEMVNLYRQLTTSECLDLYGYFSNKDTCYLLYSLRFSVNHPSLCPWLPVLTEAKQQMMTECIFILKAIMDALRVALRDRAILTNAYHYELPAKKFEIRKRNRQAILRIVEIYGSEVKQRPPKIEQLFLDMEN